MDMVDVICAVREPQARDHHYHHHHHLDSGQMEQSASTPEEDENQLHRLQSKLTFNILFYPQSTRFKCLF